MAGPDPLDAADRGQRRPRRSRGRTRQYLKADALKGKRFGVPAFILPGAGIPFHGIPPRFPKASPTDNVGARPLPLQPATREVFMKALRSVAEPRRRGRDRRQHPPRELRADREPRGARIAYMRDGTDAFLTDFGPAEYTRLATTQGRRRAAVRRLVGDDTNIARIGDIAIAHRRLETDPDAERQLLRPAPSHARAAYLEALDRLKLDGYVYPAIQMPPPDETMPQDGALSGGPHSATSWVNMIGVPAVVVVGGQYTRRPAVRPGVLGAARGRTATCWGSRTRGSRRRTTAARPCWWNRACCRRRRSVCSTCRDPAAEVPDGG